MAGAKAVVVVGLDAAAMARLEAGCAPVVCAGLPREQLLRDLADAEGILCPAPFPVGPDLLDAAPKLRVISNYGVGYNNVDLDDLTRRGIVVCNTPGVLSAAVADLTILLMLASAKRFIPNEMHARANWGRQAPPPLGFDLFGKTLGIVGLGRIGKTLVPRARALGMNVIFHDLFEDSAGLDAAYRSFDQLLAEADIVSMHTNLDAGSRHMMSTREFGLMKTTAWLINTSRGPVVDEEALVAALHAGEIAGAALDVIEVEPPAEASPILSAPNTILLPHIGTATVETRAAMLDLCLRNLLAVLNRRQPPECVNPAALDRALTR